MRRNQAIAARVCRRRTLLRPARQEGMLFGTSAEGARNANILDLRWNRPRFGLCGHLSRTVKTSSTGNGFVGNEVRRAYLRIRIIFGCRAFPAAPGAEPVVGLRIPHI